MMDREINADMQVLIEQLFDQKEKWASLLQRFISVLRMNIFIVDPLGAPLVMPQPEAGPGWRLLAESELGSAMLADRDGRWLDRFHKNDDYWEYKDPIGFYAFAVPLEFGSEDEDSALGYVVLGPVVVNKLISYDQCREIAQQHGLEVDKLIDEINEVRVVSFLDMKSILDLFREISRCLISLKFQEQGQPRHPVAHGGALPGFQKEDIQQILGTLLDTALEMTGAECGSIMLLDRKSGELSVRAFKGGDAERLRGARVRIGEGIAGLAAQENSPFVIHQDRQEDNRVRGLLKRPDIKHSVILPLSSRQGGVVGVLNMHTKHESDRFDSPDYGPKLELLQNLSRMAFSSIQQAVSS